MTKVSFLKISILILLISQMAPDADAKAALLEDLENLRNILSQESSGVLAAVFKGRKIPDFFHFPLKMPSRLLPGEDKLQSLPGHE